MLRRSYEEFRLYFTFVIRPARVYLSQFVGESVEFHLQSVGALVGRSSGVECLVHVDVHRLEVGLHASLVAAQRRHAHRQLVDTRRRVVQLVLGVLPRALRLYTIKYFCDDRTVTGDSIV